ncbi:MAG: hypothetical protein BA871_11475 [Desulfuromonadales bacterium C00003096]|jgi:hypothetical protein|nr:MAG: hypothetical protein BA871_11475 [Desulfuromonadales bacterium C00003096]
MSRLQNRLIGPCSRQFSPNSPAICSQILENLDSNSQFFVSARQDRQTPSPELAWPEFFLTSWGILVVGRFVYCLFLVKRCIVDRYLPAPDLLFNHSIALHALRR